MAFALIITIVGFLLLLDKMGIIGSDVWSYFWPVLIIAIGLSMMYNKMNHDHFFDECCMRGDHHMHKQKRGRVR